MLHHTSISWSPDRMRRLIFSVICSSGKAANVLKPTSVGITSSHLWLAVARYAAVARDMLRTDWPYVIVDDRAASQARVPFAGVLPPCAMAFAIFLSDDLLREC